MQFKSFLKLVEIQTKTASVFPFLAGTLYAASRPGGFDYINCLLMFAALLCIDMATTALNNVLDYKRAIKKQGYGYEIHNAIVRDNISESEAVATLFILIFSAVAFGGVLSWRSGWDVLILGTISFGVGILYSFGPLPISRTFLGEVLSGGVMGFIIPLLAVIIHSDIGIFLTGRFSEGNLYLKLNLAEILPFIFIFLPLAAGIANIMLANNICDREDDFENKRFTLPVMIHPKYSRLLFVLFYAAGYLGIILAVSTGLLSWWFIFFLLTAIPVFRHIILFLKEQKKSSTFVLSVKNFVIQSAGLCLLLGIQLLSGLN